MMAGLDHGPLHPKETEDPRIAARNARYGMILFLVYLLVYVGFVILNAFYPEQMEKIPTLGLNLAVLYGFGLIIFAMVLAVVYSWLCRSSTVPNSSSDGSALTSSPNEVQP